MLDLLLLSSDGLKVSSDEEINQLGPFFVSLELSSQDLDFSGQHPEDGGDGLGNSVVAGDDDINELERGIGVAESDAGDVDVGCFNNCLVIGFRVGDDKHSWFLELFGDLVGEGSWDPSG